MQARILHLIPLTKTLHQHKMRKEQQTEALKVRLYDLTLSFVRKYQPRYYKQYNGEHEDLAMDFYCNFLTEKSREKGKEASLLDKYDETITSLEYLVKISVRNMLIDRSRSNPITATSIDSFVDEHGDFMTRIFGLTTDQEDDEHVDNRTFGADFVLTASARFESLTEKAKQSIIKQYKEVRDVLAPNYQKLFEAVIKFEEEVIEEVEELRIEVLTPMGSRLECPVQQITSKTICCLVDGTIKEFNRITGEARGKAYKGLQVLAESLDIVSTKEVYHSGIERNKFVEIYS